MNYLGFTCRWFDYSIDQVTYFIIISCLVACTAAYLINNIEIEVSSKYQKDANQCCSLSLLLMSPVATEFVARVGDVFDTSDVALLWNIEGTRKYSSFEDIVRGANHLDHFHSYYKSSAAASALQDAMGSETQMSDNTIDMHADQGLFIAFVPALLIDDGNHEGISSVVESAKAGEFLIQLKDGTVWPVDFGTGDEVVFMLGDGVEQYFNPKYDGPALRAAPHAMTMPDHEPSQARAWYGRMFLPPDEALNERQGVSFGR